MRVRAALQLVLFSLAFTGMFSPAYALTEQELVAKLESAGYSQIRDLKPTAEGTAVKAVKDGKEVTLLVDSNGQFQERQEIGSANPPQLTPVQPERRPEQSKQFRDQERTSAEDVQVGRDWRTRQGDSDRLGQRRMGRTNDEDDLDHRTVGRNWQMQRDDGRRDFDEDRRRYYYDDRPRVRVKICREYEDGREVCRYRN